MEKKGTERLNVGRSSLNFQPGEVFAGRYRIIEPIGQGGMGKVFKAIDQELLETVALKMIRPELCDKPDIVERFKRELQLARKINHPHVIRIHDLGSAEGIRYISMKFIEGQSLKDLIRTSGKLTIEKAIEISIQVADALTAAHENGVVHRDLKPQNIMLDRGGNAIILDFGIARSISGESFTGTGIVVGTPDFMSPEQILGRPVDARTDIYSFGVILYEMVTGRPPFVEDNPTILLYLHLNEMPAPPSSINKAIPAWLEGVILKCIEKKPENRFASFSEIKEALTCSFSRGADVKRAGFKRLRLPWKKIAARERKWPRIIARLFLVILLAYMALSIVGIISDGIYDKKLKELVKEANESFSGRFPITKNYVPASWGKRDCDAWEIYHRLFPLQIDVRRSNEENVQVKKYARAILSNRARTMLANLVGLRFPGDQEQMRQVLGQMAKSMDLDGFNEAVSCSRLVSHLALPASITQHVILQMTYARTIILQARLDALSGKFKDGMRRISSLLIFSLDTLLSAKNVMQGYISIRIATWAIRESLPMLLDPAFKASGNYALEFDLLLREWILKTKFEMLGSLYYLELIDIMMDYLYGSPEYPPEKKMLHYYFFGRLKYWRSFFSDRKYYFEVVSDIAKMNAGFSMITKPDKVVATMMESRKKLGKDNPISQMFRIDNASFSLFHCRTLAKLALLTFQLKRSGYDLRGLTDFKATDYFLNEITGSPFELMKKNDGTVLVAVDRNMNFPIRPGLYGSEYFFLLRPFKYLDSDKLILEGLAD